MSEKRRNSLWFRLSKEEEEHIETLMAEADACKPGTLPEHSVEEHLAAARLAVKDVEARGRRIRWLFAFWVLTFVVFVGLVIYEFAG